MRMLKKRSINRHLHFCRHIDLFAFVASFQDIRARSQALDRENFALRSEVCPLSCDDCFESLPLFCFLFPAFQREISGELTFLKCQTHICEGSRCNCAFVCLDYCNYKTSILTFSAFKSPNWVNHKMVNLDGDSAEKLRHMVRCVKCCIR